MNHPWQLSLGWRLPVNSCVEHVFQPAANAVERLWKTCLSDRTSFRQGLPCKTTPLVRSGGGGESSYLLGVEGVVASKIMVLLEFRSAASGCIQTTSKWQIRSLHKAVVVHMTYSVDQSMADHKNVKLRAAPHKCRITTDPELRKLLP